MVDNVSVVTWGMAALPRWALFVPFHYLQSCVVGMRVDLRTNMFTSVVAFCLFWTS